MTMRGRFIFVFLLGILTVLAAVLVLWLLGLVDFDTRPNLLTATAGVVTSALLVTVGLALLERIAKRFDAEALALVNAVRAIAAGRQVAPLSEGAPEEFRLVHEAAVAIRDQLGLVSKQLESLSAQVVQSTGGVGGPCGEVEADNAAQGEMIRRGAEALQQLARDVAEASERIEALARRVDKSASEALRIDTGLRQAAEAAARMAADLGQTGESAREGDKALRSAAKELSDLSSGAKLTESAIAEMINGAKLAQGDAAQAAEAIGKLELEAGKIGLALEDIVKGSNAARASDVGILEVTAALSSRVDRMDDVLAVIRDLADRTKLLSINASIIASEAGEHGRAFAVVAREVKELAQSTSGAIAEISQVVSGLKDGFAHTVDTILKGQSDAEQETALAEKAVRLLTSFSAQVESAAAWNRQIGKHASDQVSRGLQVREGAEALAPALEKVQQILAAQTSRNESAVALFYALASAVDEVVKSVGECASLLKEVNPTTEAAVSEFRDLARSERERIVGLGELISLAKETLSVNEVIRKKTAGLAEALGELNRYAYYLGEDFRKKAGGEPL